MSRARALLAALLVVGIVPAAAGCGFGEGSTRPGGGATLRVTRDFGHKELGSTKLDSVRESETVMRMLRSDFDVTTRFGGRFVQSIDGLEGQGAGGQADWFYWVNGLEADKGAAEWEVLPGRPVQWDHRDWSAAMRIPAIVGAYPEPFANGLEGKRRPVRVECEQVGAPACSDARKRLNDVGVSTSGSALGAPGTEAVHATRGGALAAGTHRPRRRRPRGRARDHRRVRPLHARRRHARAARREAAEPPGVCSAATARGSCSPCSRAPTSSSGSSRRSMTQGLEAGVRALDERKLRNAFAVAATGDRVEKLPLVGAMSLIPVYRSRPSALHSARAGARRRVLRRARAHRRAVPAPARALGGARGDRARRDRRGRGAGDRPLAAVRAAVRAADRAYQPACLSSEGDTLLFRGGEVLGHRIDITLEATVAGALDGLRVIVIVLGVRPAVCRGVDPDQLLRLFRRVSYRSALTASLATRLVPVLARDATRMGDAARCRPHPPGRLAVARAALVGRARPGGRRGGRARGARLRARRAHRARRHSRGRATTGAWAARPLLIAMAAVAGAIAGLGSVEAYPTLRDRDRAARACAERGRRAARARPVRGARRAAGGGPCLTRLWWRERFSYRYPEATSPSLRRR